MKEDNMFVSKADFKPEVLENDGIILDIFTPMREDFIGYAGREE